MKVLTFFGREIKKGKNRTIIQLEKEPKIAQSSEKELA